MNVNLPSSAAKTRGLQTAFLAEEIAARWNDQELVSSLELAKDSHDRLSEDEKSVVRIMEHAGRFYFKVPQQVIADSARLTSEAFMVWQDAKRDNSFTQFAPYLEQIVELSRTIADHLGYHHNPYDALLDLYDQGLAADVCTDTFNQLQPELTSLLKDIQASKSYQLDTSTNSGGVEYSVQDQKRLAHFILNKMGYDFSAGRLDTSTHPFSIDLGQGDARITTYYPVSDFRQSFAASMHEGGHALYTQGVDSQYAQLGFDSELSFAVHESQSRFWENHIGRSPSFLKAMLPVFQSTFPKQLSSVSLEELVRSFNLVQPGLIRIEADEVTYALHIMVRFELEHDLINQKMKVAELPEAWRAKYKHYLGVEPTTDSDGVLQDVHWSNGYIGYFPSYALGNLYAAQFTHQLTAAMPFDELVAQLEFGQILSWLRQNIHQYGSYYSAADLLQRVTGEPLNPQYFMEYLRNKYGEIYALNR